MVQLEQFPRSPGHHPSPCHHPVPDAANGDMTVTRFTQPQPRTTKLVVLCSAACGRVLRNTHHNHPFNFWISHSTVPQEYVNISFKPFPNIRLPPKMTVSPIATYLNLAYELDDPILNQPSLSCALLSSGCCCSLNLFNSALQRCRHTMPFDPRDVNIWTNENLSCKWFFEGTPKESLKIRYW